MTKLNLILGGCIAFILHSCGQPENNTQNSVDLIDVSTTELSDRPVFQNIEYVKLETSQESLLEGVQKVVAAGDKLYILTSIGGNIMVFNKQGDFCYKLSKGKGPNEIVYPTDVIVNEKDNTFSVLDMYRTIKTFQTKDGQQVAEPIQINDPSFNFEISGSDLLLFEPNLTAQSDHYLRYLHKDGSQTNLLPKSVGGTPFTQPTFLTKIGEDSLLVNYIFSDTIYLTDTEHKQLHPYCVLDFKTHNANKSDLLKQMANYSEYRDYLKEHDLISGPVDLALLNHKLFLSVIGSKHYYFVTYDPKSQKSTTSVKLFEDLPNIYNSIGRDSKNLIFSMNTSWIIEHFTKNPNVSTPVARRMQEECVNENDNPVLIFASF